MLVFWTLLGTGEMDLITIFDSSYSRFSSLPLLIKKSRPFYYFPHSPSIKWSRWSIMWFSWAVYNTKQLFMQLFMEVIFLTELLYTFLSCFLIVFMLISGRMSHSLCSCSLLPSFFFLSSLQCFHIASSWRLVGNWTYDEIYTVTFQSQIPFLCVGLMNNHILKDCNNFFIFFRKTDWEKVVSCSQFCHYFKMLNFSLVSKIIWYQANTEAKQDRSSILAWNLLIKIYFAFPIRLPLYILLFQFSSFHFLESTNSTCAQTSLLSPKRN